MIFTGKQSGIFHNFTRDVDPGYKFIEKFGRRIEWCMMERKDFISNISCNLKNKNEKFVSSIGQPTTFRLSKKKQLLKFFTIMCRKR